MIWALVLGLRKTGSTFFVMDEGADSGGILSQREIQIEERETATSLYGKIEVAIEEQIPRFLPGYLAHVLKPTAQASEPVHRFGNGSSVGAMIVVEAGSSEKYAYLTCGD